MAEWTLSVGELNEYVRKKLAGDPMLRAVRVRGEISGFKRHVSGHLYFTLKDETSRVSCAMFRQHAVGLSFQPADGQSVVVTAAAGLYPVSGTYQLYVENMEKDGMGDLFEKFERLKKKLQAEGLFDPAVKKPLPVMPKTIGVVTSRVGAAFRDIVRVALHRNPHIRILIAPCAVQGAGASEEIARAIERLNADGRAEVLLVGRGGGSMEDLWAFNEERVARAVFASRIPVISCVGHEIDFTIADFAADARAATPSNAAELAVPEIAELSIRLKQLKKRLDSAFSGMVSQKRLRLEALMRSACITNPVRMLIDEKRQRADHMLTRLNGRMREILAKKKTELTFLNGTLKGLDPKNVLNRGYAILHKDGATLSDAVGILPGDRLTIEMKNNYITVTVEDISGKEQP